MPTKHVTVKGITTHYIHHGKSTLPDRIPDLSRGELLLLVHAAGSNANTWQPQLSGLAERHSPLAFDFPGHGRSGGTDGFASIDAYRDFLASFTETLQLRSAVLIGRSMGGLIAMAYALAHPQRVRALILVATAAKITIAPEKLDTWRNVMLGRATQPFTNEAFSPSTDFSILREAWMEQVKTDPRVRYFDLMACNECDLRAQLAQIRTPTLIVAGRHDTLTPPALAEELQAGIRGSRLVVIDDAGHTVPNEKPADFNAVVEDFLNGLPK